MKKLLLITALTISAITYPPVQAKFCTFCATDDFNKLISSNTKVVVDFFAPWCGPCKAMAPHFEALGNEMTDVLFIKFDYDAFSHLASDSKSVRSFPTLKAYKNGKVVATEVGYKSKAALKSWVQSVLP